MPIKNRNKILLIGYGGMGKRYYENLKKRFEISVVETKIKDLKKKNFYKDIKDVNLKNFYFGIISSPANTHYKYCSEFTKNNLDFIVEKPLFVKKKGWNSLLKKIKIKKIFCEVAYPRRHAESYNYIKKIVKKNIIGSVKIIRFNFSQDFKKFRKDYNKTYYSKIKTGGGVTRDALTHHINLASFFLGKILHIDIFEKRISFKDVKVPDTASLKLSFKKNYHCEIFGNQFQKPNIDEMEIIGEKGNLKFNRIDNKLYLIDSYSKKMIKQFDETYDEIFKNQILNFIYSIKKKRKPQTSLFEDFYNLSKLEVKK